MKKGTRKPKPRTSPQKKTEEEKPGAAVPDEQTAEDGRMDFGGLPNRDLKKNLGGCG